MPDAKRPGGTGGLPDVIVVLARRVTRSRLAVAIDRPTINHDEISEPKHDIMILVLF